MTTLRTRVTAALALAGLAALGAAHGALAHDLKTVGPYKVALGWLHEPAYVGFDNAVQFLVKDASGAGVSGVDTLTVDVSLGTASMNGVKLVETADPDTGLGTPGDYHADFIPTAPGNFTFHVKGAIKGTAIDDSVTAGPSTFNTVRAADAAQFPVKVPAASDVAARIDAVATRVDTLPRDVQAAQAMAASVQGSAQDARDAANRALVVGIVALVLALLLGAGNLLAMRRRSRSGS